MVYLMKLLIPYFNFLNAISADILIVPLQVDTLASLKSRCVYNVESRVSHKLTDKARRRPDSRRFSPSYSVTSAWRRLRPTTIL